MNTMKEKTIKTASQRLAGWLMGFALTVLGMQAQAAALTDIQADTLPGDGMELRLQFDGQAPQSKGYSIEQPARIALDLLEATNGLGVKQQNLGAGNVRSVTIVEAKNRTRLIFNLETLTGYSTRAEGNQLVVRLGEDQGQSQQQKTASASTSSANGQSALRNLDFRRGPKGQGRVIVTLSKPSIPVDVSEEGGQIVARFVGAGVPDAMLRKLDVTDFATPVTFVDTKPSNGDAVVRIDATGEWDYMAYQTDNVFTINVEPLAQQTQAAQKAEKPEYTGEKLSLNFQDIEVRSVLQLIADFTGLNLVASDTVSGTITLRLKNVPWDQALDLILKTKGLDKRKVGNVLMVAPADEIAAREQLELESKKKVEALAPLKTDYISMNYAEAGELAKLIEKRSGAKSASSLLSERGSVAVDTRTNTLIVQDTREKLEEIRGLIEQLDVPVQQVLIEARVVIATDDISDEFGVRWGGLAFDGEGILEDQRGFGASGRLQPLRDLHGTNIDAADFVATPTGTDPDDEDVDFVPGSATFETPDEQSGDDLIVDLGVDAAEASRFAVGFTSLASGLIELELSALEAEGHGELVATPKVLTADQQPAVIASGKQVPFNVSTSSGATAVEFVDAELRLEVTPHITPEGDVVMELNVNNDSVGSFVNNVPTVNTNRVETTVLVKDGETVVLGGIFQQEKLDSVTKTPFLGDLPWIGNLFRKTVKRDNKQELLIFITPRLMQDTLAGR